MTIRGVIVDDEAPAREKLRALARTDGRVRIVGEAAGGRQAVALIERLRPELVFLDIQMPEVDGFEVLEALDVDPFPHVIFVTAHDEHAVRAFRVRALDYLLKPVDPDRFTEAVDRAAGASTAASDPRVVLDELAADGRQIKRFLVRRRGDMRLIPIEAVDWIAAAGNYVELHIESGTYLVRGSLQELERRLPPNRFVRIHRSAIVNLDRIRSLHPWSHGDWLVILRDGTELRMSRRYRDRIDGVFGP